jgi:PAS domain S-box-containing protein
MKSRKRKAKTSIKDIIRETFMQSPIPMSISTEDGTYIEINEAAIKYMGLQRKEIIGRKSTDLGYVSKEQRKLFIDSVKKHGFAKHMPLELKVDDKVLYLLFDVFPIKVEKDNFFLCCASDVCNHRPDMKKFEGDKFIKLTGKDVHFIRGKLRNYKLTPRQQEIVLLSLKGYSNLEIAETLYLSPHTVKDHLKDIFHIIGVRHRSGLFPKLLNF